MVGRPRKKGKREPNGRIARAYVDPRKQVASQPHRRGVPEQFRDREEAESNFGRLMLNGRITPAQYEAGKRYATLAAKYRAVLSAPSPNARSIDWADAIGGYDGDMPVHIARQIKIDYDAAFEACGEAGNRAQRAVKDHAVFDKPVTDSYAQKLLIAGIDKLVVHFGIDPFLRIRSCQK